MMLPEDLTPEQFSKKPAVLKALNNPRSPISVLNYMCGCDINNPNDEENNKDEENDPLYEKALALIIKEKKVSTSFLQRHFAIGYNRAARIVDIFEKKGIVSTANSMGRREVLIDRDD